MARLLPFLAFLLLTPFKSPAQPDSLSRSEKLADLRDRILPLRTVDPTDDSFSDLRPLTEVIGDRRIVILGEPTHGDGRAFCAKSRLVKFLHQELDFGVLAFESGFYDLRLATDRASSPEEHLQAATNNLARPWAQSKQVRPLLRYYAQTQSTDVPLHLAGIDGAVRPPNDSIFVARLQQHLREQNRWADVAKGTEFEQTLRKQLTNPLFLARDTSAYRRFVGRVDDFVSALQDGSSEDQFWALMLNNVKAQAQTGFQRSYDPRNRQMARTLVWLAEEVYPQEKIVVWSASSHGLRNLSSIERLDSKGSYEGRTSMGDALAERFEGGTYTLGITAHGGQYGAFYWEDQDPETIVEPSAGSLEALLGALPHDYSILNFTDVSSSHWLSQPQVSRVLGYTEMRADWTEVMDGLLFIRTMQPNTKVEQ
jgi:erythromycin esterase